MPAIELRAIDEGIALLVMQGSRANAMGEAFCAELLEALERVRADSGVRGLMLTGAGRFFSAGRDLREADERGPLRPAGNAFEAALRAAFAFPKPLAAAVNGHAIAGGLVLALAADYCVLAEGDYKVGLTELDIGLPLPRVAFEILRQALPRRALTRLVYGADLIGPAEAFALGVGEALVPAAQLQDAALSWLRPVAARPLPAFAVCKRWLRAEATERILNQSVAEQELYLEAVASDETRARLAAYAARLRG
jgi:enoyl-CoA hydratase